jgi:hypothetical protein
MKRVTTLVTLLCLLVVPVLATAQEEAKPEKPGVTYIMHYEETVHPAHMMEYIEGTQKWIEAIKEAGIDLQFYADAHLNKFGYMLPYSDFSQMNEIAGKWHQAVGLLRQSEWGQARQAAIKSSIYSIWMHDPELSYWPEGSTGPSPATPFIDVFEARTTHADEMNFRKQLAEWKKAEVTQEWSKGYNVYRNIIGAKGPSYVIVSFGESPSKYFAHGEKVWMEHQEELMKMRMNMGKYMVEMKQYYSWMRPDLSLMKMPEAGEGK